MTPHGSFRDTKVIDYLFNFEGFSVKDKATVPTPGIHPHVTPQPQEKPNRIADTSLMHRGKKLKGQENTSNFKSCHGNSTNYQAAMGPGSEVDNLRFESTQARTSSKSYKILPRLPDVIL
jgi:hypothetical protein